MSFTEQKFTIPSLKGISAKTIEEHLKLYAGYVKHANLIRDELSKKDGGEYARAEMMRRFGFEYNGMRNNEVYFASLEGGSTALTAGGPLQRAIEKNFGGLDAWLAGFKTLALTRGIGWAMLYYDRKDGRLLNAWVDEQHLGQLQDCALILGLDMWEHSFVADYQPSGKKQYIEDFFASLNWSAVEKNFSEAAR